MSEETRKFPNVLLGGRLRVEGILGRGAMGIVYEATDELLGRRVAVKALADVNATQEQRLRLGREARAAAQLRSEHAVRILELGEEAGRPFIVMEKMTGRTLDVVLEEDGPLSIECAIRWMVEALDAIAEAHASGLVHRDIKPANLFLAERTKGEPIVKVMDFGIVRDADPLLASLTEKGTAMGTPAYMAPEQIRAVKDLDARADVWAIGVTLHELLTRRMPFEAPRVMEVLARIMNGRPTSVRAHRPEVPIAVQAVIFRCLATNRRKRFASAGEVRAALEAILAGMAPTIARTPDDRDDSRARARRGLNPTSSEPHRPGDFARPTPPHSIPAASRDVPPPRRRVPLTNARVLFASTLLGCSLGVALLLLLVPRSQVHASSPPPAPQPAAAIVREPVVDDAAPAVASLPAPAAPPRARTRSTTIRARGLDPKKMNEWVSRMQPELDACANPLPCEDGQIVLERGGGSEMFRRSFRDSVAKPSCEHGRGVTCVMEVVSKAPTPPWACSGDGACRAEIDIRFR